MHQNVKLKFFFGPFVLVHVVVTHFITRFSKRWRPVKTTFLSSVDVNKKISILEMDAMEGLLHAARTPSGGSYNVAEKNGIAGLIASVDATFKAVYICDFCVPLFIDNDDIGDRQKWFLWLVHKLLLVAIYAIACLTSNDHRLAEQKMRAMNKFEIHDDGEVIGEERCCTKTKTEIVGWM
eukprot:Gb_37913 [translate_table: standard]